MTEPVVRIRSLVKAYAGRPAVDGVDLDVHRGECVALLGPNGAGKTTTVEILEGYRKRDSGDALVLGHDPAEPTAGWRQRIGIVLQSATDNGDLTVGEIVHHFAHYYRAPRDPDAVIEAVGLTETRHSRARTLSGGQRRRLDVALGILGDPELLFLDEPTTGFDPEARQAFWGLIDRLRRSGTTILLTSHYLEEAERLADRVAIISGGRIVAEGDPRSIGRTDDELTVVSWLAPAGRQTVRTGEPTRLVTELAGQFAGEVPGLTVRRPTLEEIYLRLVDSSIRDESVP